MSNAKNKDVVDLEVSPEMLEAIKKAREEEVPNGMEAEETEDGSRVLRLKDPEVVDYDEKTHKELFSLYEVEYGEEKETVKRNVLTLMRHLDELDQDSTVTVRIFQPMIEEKGDEQKQVVHVYKLVDNETPSAAVNLLKNMVIPGQQVLSMIMEVLMQNMEFTDLNTMMLTGIFELQGVQGYTWTNPGLEPSENMSNLVYESSKSHVENYKDSMKKKFNYKFQDGGIVAANMGDLRNLVKK